eukprot:3422772-Pleurochrysis_carterae.AAC.1
MACRDLRSPRQHTQAKTPMSFITQPSEQKSPAADEEMKEVAAQLLELGVSMEKQGTKSMSAE